VLHHDHISCSRSTPPAEFSYRQYSPVSTKALGTTNVRNIIERIHDILGGSGSPYCLNNNKHPCHSLVNGLRLCTVVRSTDPCPGFSILNLRHILRSLLYICTKNIPPLILSISIWDNRVRSVPSMHEPGTLESSNLLQCSMILRNLSQADFFQVLLLNPQKQLRTQESARHWRPLLRFCRVSAGLLL
jgi:hypothetical protein